MSVCKKSNQKKKKKLDDQEKKNNKNQNNIFGITFFEPRMVHLRMVQLLKPTKQSKLLGLPSKT